MELTLVCIVIFVALVFTYTNGFHDTANAIATVVGTKVLTPRQAILLAAVTNLIGAFFGIAVAKTISGGIVDQSFLSTKSAQVVIICTLVSAIFWNLLTWWFGMPSSSTHALVGSLVGATFCAASVILAADPGKFDGKSAWETSVKWEEIKDKKSHRLVDPSPEEIAALGGATDFDAKGRPVSKEKTGTHHVKVNGEDIYLGVFEGRIRKVESVIKPGAEKAGILWKVIVPMVISPLTGFVVGFIVMGLLYAMLRSWRPITVNRIFGKAQLASSAYMGFGHGMNDATKTMGVITLALVGATKGGLFDDLPGWLTWLKVPEGTDPYNLPLVARVIGWLPSWLQFGYMPDAVVDNKAQGVPDWVILVCALTMAAGTAAGGWRIIKTMGHKMVKLQPVHGFAAETTAATVLAVTGNLGMPVSTTHAITTTIMGVGCAKRFSALKLNVVERILWAWIMTLPATGAVAYALVWLCAKADLIQGI
ncbi:MAG: inorganic phosphate transporter [Verrucomicrobiales bacterium]|nr:inorganic phosphate transporter [Verrucomicrobiales bacterium]